MTFVELLRKTRAEVLRQNHSALSPAAEEQMPWMERLRRAKSGALARSTDPWRLRLERVRGKIGYDGVERISTQDVFDCLGVLQRARTAGACRRLATLMRELGWTSMKARGLGSERLQGSGARLRSAFEECCCVRSYHHQTITPSHTYLAG